MPSQNQSCSSQSGIVVPHVTEQIVLVFGWCVLTEGTKPVNNCVCGCASLHILCP
jgi:hypothetical protein